jgi:hypothetical protein
MGRRHCEPGGFPGSRHRVCPGRRPDGASAVFPDQGFPESADDPLDYLLDKTAETVWEAASSAQSELEPHLKPVRNYLAALAGNAGVEPARDFALGVLTERVRQEENGWPDQPGDPRGRRTGHGTGPSHSCLLERKHQVEDAIYEALPSTRGA